ncbi:uncharacterized protein LOC117582587 [Drosophila guanche]|uniref:Uncharacterized protein n=1 Tax=Drosophila guanche TaxID=7266 RepID=A0A3B0JPD8_DROGU|nr:uncharacterized protein LOC117582587 [Drosophila guanche]SPP75479.1 Hypothetical predicted protein [Drosophila guanche]
MLLVPLLTLIAVLRLTQTLPLDDAESSLSPVTSELPDGSGRVVFDQRQTGKYNIHVSIKDVAIIEVGQNDLTDGAYNDAEDYYYDDSALTIKPIKFSTEAIGSSTSSSSSSISTTAAAATTSTEHHIHSSTTEPSTGTTLKESTMATVAPSLSSLNGSSAYSSNLLADIAASRIRPKSRLNNLMIVETPIGGARAAAVPHLPHPRSKDIPIMAAAAVTRPSQPQAIEYTPPQGHNSPIFKVKVQRSALAPNKKPAARCRSHQTRNAQGKCGDSIYRRLYSMLMGLNIPGLVGTPPHAAATAVDAA